VLPYFIWTTTGSWPFIFPHKISTRNATQQAQEILFLYFEMIEMLHFKFGSDPR